MHAHQNVLILRLANIFLFMKVGNKNVYRISRPIRHTFFPLKNVT